jgi:ribosome-binding protein aMBF1 (putative translation factor)
MTTGRVKITDNVARKMRKAREGLELSQSQLAEKVKIPRARIKRIECLELSTLDEREYERLLLALKIVKPRKRSASSVKPNPSRIRARRALEKAGLLDVTLREILG